MEEVAQFHIPIEPSHTFLALACLGVLLCLDDCTDEDSVKKIMKKVPLFKYADDHWLQHALFGNVEFQIKDALHHFFDLNKPHFLAWVQITTSGRWQWFLFLPRAPFSEHAVPLSAAPLFFALFQGFCDLQGGLVQHLISKYPEQVNQKVNYWEASFGTPLHASVAKGNIHIAKLLFKHGANINSCNAKNETPLHFASWWRHFRIGKWLLHCGADVNFQWKDGKTPLHLLVQLGGDNLKFTWMLLKHNADINARDNRGITPVFEASKYRNPDLLQLLLDHNADVQVHDNKGVTPLHMAATKGCLKVVQILLKYNVDVNARDDQGTSPFLRASAHGNPQTLQLLLDHNADVQVCDKKGVTPLHKAVSGGHLEVAWILLKHDAEVNAWDNQGATPFLVASERGKPRE